MKKLECGEPVIVIAKMMKDGTSYDGVELVFCERKFSKIGLKSGDGFAAGGADSLLRALKHRQAEIGEVAIERAGVLEKAKC